MGVYQYALGVQLPCIVFVCLVYTVHLSDLEVFFCYVFICV